MVKETDIINYIQGDGRKEREKGKGGEREREVENVMKKNG